MNIAAYCRVSTDTADQLNSLETQKSFFVEYAQRQGHNLIHLYADEGLSGTKVKRRKQFQQMMADAELGLFELLVVKDISRLARNTVDLLQSVRHLKVLGIQVVFLTANMTSLGDSEFILTVFGALAQEESANTSKRVKFGKRLNAEKGRVPNLIYGYDKIPGEYFSLSINEEEAAAIRSIFSWYLDEACGASKIAARLNQRGLKTKRGCAWSQNAVCRILTNPIYTGKVINGKQEISDFLTSARADRSQEDWLIVDRPELRIVEDERFQQAVDLMIQRGRTFHQEGKRHSNQYLFSTLIRCKDCGWSFRRVTRTYRTTYVRWVCSRRNGQGAGECPNATSVDEVALVEQLDRYFRSLLGDQRHVEQLLRQALKRACRSRDDADSRKAAQARLSRLQKQRQKYIELYTDNLITQQELKEKLEDSKGEMSTLEAELQQLQALTPDDAAIERVIQQTFQNPTSFLSVRNFNNAQLKQLISKIEVDKDGNVDVYLRLFSTVPPREP